MTGKNNPSELIFDSALIAEKLQDLDSSSRLSLKDDHFISSAVVFLLVPRRDTPYDLVLIRRTTRESDKHSGEMSFPGGKFDPDEDETLLDTALRECEEELGIPNRSLEVLGSFDDHITPKGFIITPIVGFLKGPQRFVKQEEEVSEIVPIPVSFFADANNYRERTYMLNDEMIAVGKYKYISPGGKKYVIFGATSHLIVHYVQQVHGIPLMKKGARRLSCEDLRARFSKP